MMKPLHATVLVFTFLTAVLLWSQTNSTPAKPKIGIMKFEVDADLKPALSTFLYESFSGEMVASGAFTVVDWEQLDKVQKVVAQAQPNVSPEEARRMALHQLGIEKLYLGSLTKVGSKFYLTMKVLNLDLKVERSERLPAASEDDLEPTVVKLAKMLAANPEQAKEIKAHLDRQKAETDRWVEVQKELTEETLSAFLKEFPDGALSVNAKKSLEEVRSKRAASEAERKAKEAERQIAAKEAEQLKKNIAGRWKLETAPGTPGGHNSVPSGRVCEIEQKGVEISFKAPWVGKEATYKGSYESGTLYAKGKWSIYSSGPVITGVISEDGKRIVGNWQAGGYSGTAIFTRQDSPINP